MSLELYIFQNGEKEYNFGEREPSFYRKGGLLPTGLTCGSTLAFLWDDLWVQSRDLPVLGMTCGWAPFSSLRRLRYVLSGILVTTYATNNTNLNKT